MATKIQIRRGLEADLPTLSVGELGFTTDSHLLYIGTSTGNVLVKGGGGSLIPEIKIVRKRDVNVGLLKNFAITNPLPQAVVDLIVSGQLKLQVWVYRYRKIKKWGNSSREYTQNGYVHPQDRIATSLITGYTRPTQGGWGPTLGISGLLQDHLYGGYNSLLNTSQTTFNNLPTKTAQYNGWIRTELPVVAGDVQSDNSLKIDLSKFVTSWLANGLIIERLVDGLIKDIYVDKSTINETAQYVQFNNAIFSNPSNSLFILRVANGVLRKEKDQPMLYSTSDGVKILSPQPYRNSNIEEQHFIKARPFGLQLVGTLDGENLEFGPMLTPVFMATHYMFNTASGYLTMLPKAKGWTRSIDYWSLYSEFEI
jgi:hypothetical protein